MPGTTLMKRPIDMGERAKQRPWDALMGGAAASGSPSASPSAGPPVSPYALIGQKEPPLDAAPQSQAPMSPPPAVSAPPSALAHPADDMGQMQAQLMQSGMSPRALQLIAHAEDHAAHAIGTLLKKRGDITTGDLDGAAKVAARGGPIGKQMADQFLSSLPPVSDQSALRGALMQMRERNIRGLVAIHAAAQSQGVDLTGRNR